MTESKKVQLYTDRECTIEAFPETSAKYVTLSDGLDLESVLKHDLTAPTVTHEETSFKVGKGDIDVSSSIVDGEPSKVVIKGKTYQNILPEPSLRNSMKNGKSMQKFNTGYDSVNVVDGVVKSAILRGQTLVNLFKNSEINYEFNHTNSTTSNLYGFLGRNDLIMTLDKSKVYYIIERWQITDRTDKTSTINFQPKVFYADGSEAYFSYNTPFYVGVHTVKRKIQFPKNVTGFHLGVVNIPNNIIKGKSLGCVIMEYQDGMENWDIPYFTGMTSVKMPVLSSIGKNLFDGKWEDGLWNASTGEAIIDGTSSVRNINRIAVTPNSTLMFSNNGATRTTNILEYDKNGNFIKFTESAYKITTTSSTKYINIHGWSNDRDLFQIEYGSTITTYEPHKSNILSLSEEVVLRSLPSGVYDTYNIVTKEYVQRIKEVAVTFDATSVSDTLISNAYSYVISPVDKELNMETGFLCDKVPKLIYYGNDGTCGMYENKMNFVIWDKNVTSKQEFANKYSGLKLQYKLATPVIKTVDLSSFGNWEKVVLDGSEEWHLSKENPNNNAFFLANNCLLNNVEVNTNNSEQRVICQDLAPMIQGELCNKPNNKYGISLGWAGNILCVRDERFPLTNDGLTQWKEYLQQNPITVWYQTTTSQANSIKEMLSFSNGHIQLSSGVGDGEHSLIPSFDYEVPTSNSYHMDLMKADTNYTVKSTNPNGTCDIGDMKGITIPSNYLWNVPSARKGNMLLVVHGSWTNPMILEGDLTSKALPYFKGIKSAFEDDSKIEVLSTGKNLCDSEPDIVGHYVRLNDGVYVAHNDFNISKPIPVVYGNRYRTNTNLNHAYYDENVNYIKTSKYEGGTDGDFYTTPPKGAKYLRVSMSVNQDPFVGIYDLSGEYKEPNISKIPLLHSLKSLSSGVYDELVINRAYNKATLIQRVGKIVLDGSEEWQVSGWTVYPNTYAFNTALTLPNVVVSTPNTFSNRLSLVSNLGNVDVEGYVISGTGKIVVRINRGELTTSEVEGVKSWLTQNPITVYYELSTPIITEVNIEGFPNIYKDGHIFLNSEIAPLVEIAYTSNQTQQIKANNETLIRHEIDIDSLEGLIAGFIEADYQLRLFQFDYDMLNEKETTI